ncbi:hypothetical protein A8B78_14230 [Jannaschia sp. EhC01]|nr:hypothetical protein A8B78_14230 [Jannaschia sp. EhC01]
MTGDVTCNDMQVLAQKPAKDGRSRRLGAGVVKKSASRVVFARGKAARRVPDLGPILTLLRLDGSRAAA